MNAEQYLNEALGGNMNISTLKPLAWYEIMEGYARHKLAETQPQADNSQSDAIALCNKWELYKPRNDCECPIILAALLRKMESIAQQHT